MPCAAEYRRVGDTVLDAELAEPAIGKVRLHLGAESSPAMLTSVNRTTLEIGLAFGISALFGSRRRLAQIPRFSAGCQGFGYR